MNYEDSAGGMEKLSAVNIFKRSVEKNNVRYSTCIGDGDTSSYAAVVSSKPYSVYLIPKKDACVGHVQKRVGTRLRTMKANDKTLGGNGNGKLTDKAINNLQNSVALAIRQNFVAWKQFSRILLSTVS